jgi:hypothetical protein
MFSIHRKYLSHQYDYGTLECEVLCLFMYDSFCDFVSVTVYRFDKQNPTTELQVNN